MMMSSLRLALALLMVVGLMVVVLMLLMTLLMAVCPTAVPFITVVVHSLLVSMMEAVACGEIKVFVVGSRIRTLPQIMLCLMNMRSAGCRSLMMLMMMRVWGGIDIHVEMVVVGRWSRQEGMGDILLIA